MNTQAQTKEIDNNLTYLDFASFEELSQHPDILDSLITDYCNIFGEPDVWNEDYSHDDILDKLQHELDGHAAMRLCINKVNNEVVGFCWAQLLDANMIIAAIESVDFYQSYGSPKIDDTLREIIGDKSVIYIQDLGVNKFYRGTIPLEQLICPVIENVSHHARTRNLFFWSVADTCVAWLAQKIGINVALTVGKMQFFSGEFPSLENIISTNPEDLRISIQKIVSADNV